MTAPTAELARRISDRAEELRRTLAINWLGDELAPWTDRCLVTVDAENRRLSGETTYLLLRGEVRRWRMELRGDPQRILDVLLPHEVVHTVLASHFKCAIPRWADEGAALSAEDPRERLKFHTRDAATRAPHELLPLSMFLELQQYPDEPDEIRNFYWQGASLTAFLLHAGKTEFVHFISHGIDAGWDEAIRNHYGFRSVADLENAWKQWLDQDQPPIRIDPQQLLVSAVKAGRLDEIKLKRVSTLDAADRIVPPVAGIAAAGGGAR